MTPEAALSLWERALSEDIGVIITLDDVRDKKMVENTLYEARQISGNPDLDALMLAHPGDAPQEIWIVKKMTDMSDLGGEA